MNESERIKKELEKFKKKGLILEELGGEIETLINNILYEYDIKFHTIIYRVKKEDSLKNKMKTQKKNLSDIEDLLGIRIIGYLNSEVEEICKIIEKEFKIMAKKEFDGIKKGKGYRGINYTVQLSEKRNVLPEYKRYKSIKFEIQIVTILSHSWSEIQHDRNYRENIPEEFREQFNLLASSLKLLDYQFNDLCNKIDDKIQQVKEKTKKGDIDEIKIDAASLRGFFDQEFEKYLGLKLMPIFGAYDSELRFLLIDLKKMGIFNLGQLNKIIPSWIDEYFNAQRDYMTTYADLLRDLLTIEFKETYIKKTISPWQFEGLTFTEKEQKLFEKNGVKYLKIMEKMGNKIVIEN